MSPMPSLLINTRKPVLALWVAAGLAVLALGFLVWQESAYYQRQRKPQGGLPEKKADSSIPAIPSVTRFLEKPGAVGAAVTNIFHSLQVDHALARFAEAKQAEEAARKAAFARMEKAARDELARKAVLEMLEKKAREQAARRDAEVRTAQLKTDGVLAEPALPPGTRFTYQGLIQPPGGERLALIAAQPPGKTYSCAAGEVCAGVAITNITVDAVELILADGALRRAEAGKPEFIRKELLNVSR